VLSVTLDHWTPTQLRMMELGGNQRWTDFLHEQGIKEDMPIREKYSTRAAAWYRTCLRAEAEGLEPPAPLPPGTGHLLAEGRPNPALAVLDRVYASVPCGNSVKRDAMTKALELHARAEASRRKPQSQANALEWMCREFQQILHELLLFSDGDETPLRLKEMSSGSMEGFGGERSSLLAFQPDTAVSEVVEGQPPVVEAT